MNNGFCFSRCLMFSSAEEEGNKEVLLIIQSSSDHTCCTYLSTIRSYDTVIISETVMTSEIKELMTFEKPMSKF